MRKNKKWVLRDPGQSGETLRALATETGLSPVTVRLLCARGYNTGEKIKEFLSLAPECFADPFLMRDMRKAAEGILSAVEAHRKIVIYGDYDVDGVTSVTVLYLYLSSIGADVSFYIPSREREGYGVSVPAVGKLAVEGAGLIVTVDTGITAIEETEYARSLGVEMIVTDHHECQEDLPDALAVVNPHRPDCPYPFKDLAGVGVVFKLVLAIETIRNPEGVSGVFEQYVDLAAVGTIADVMPIIGENRYMVSRGLERMRTACRPGFAALMEASANFRKNPAEKEKMETVPKKPRKITSGYISFGIAPRINAAGRIDHAEKAVRLLLEDHPERAAERAWELCEINYRRQAEENRVAEQAYRKLEAQQEERGEPPRVIVLEDDHWMQGIIGIVASRLTDSYGVPSILISFDGATRGYPAPDDVGKGSGRSVHGINLVDALAENADLLVRFGGHELAAGLSIRRCEIDTFRERLDAYVGKCLGGEPPALVLEADCEVAAEELTMELATELERLEPFGTGNATPMFLLRHARIRRIIPLGGGKHSKFVLEKDGCILNAVWFGVGPEALPFDAGESADLLFQININEYRGVSSLQLLLQDARYSGEPGYSQEAEKQRYREISEGGTYSREEQILPTREDFVAVYTLLRREFRAGRQIFRHRALLTELRETTAPTMNYARLKYVLRIMNELRICGINETREDEYLVDIYFQQEKAVIDRSSILKTLKTRCRDFSGT